MRWQPSLQIVPHYESEPLYIKALVNSLKLKISQLLETRFILKHTTAYPKNILIKGTRTTVIVIKLQGLF